MIDTMIEKTFAADAYTDDPPVRPHALLPHRRRDRPRRCPRRSPPVPEQGWSLLCNGVVVFEDFGELLPNGQSVDSRRVDLLAASPHRCSA